MKSCPVCTLDVDDAYLFCPDDGASLRSKGGSSDYRVAAIATVIALTVFALAAAYALVSGLSKRPTPSVTRTGSTEETTVPSLLFVPTPQEARDYQEHAPASEPATQASTAKRPLERESQDVKSPAPTKSLLQNSAATRSVQERSETTAAQPPSAITRVSTPPVPAVRGNTAGFEARLIHARSRRTQSGFRYDLTFNMQEQAGRASHWQRLLITTRSATGRSHSEAIPFVHRLGATGSLTFTISVELTGPSQGDWQGQLLCTTLGWDNTGAPLQARFGTNVTP